MSIILGVDPGVTGALALIDTDGPHIIDILDMPVLSDGKRKFFDSIDLENCWGEGFPWVPERAIVEDAQVARAGKQINGSATLTLGRIIGGCEAELLRRGIPMTHVTPAQWKRAAGLLKADKKASLGKARVVFGASAQGWFDRQKDHNRSEAALIALFGSKL